MVLFLVESGLLVKSYSVVNRLLLLFLAKLSLFAFKCILQLFRRY